MFDALLPLACVISSCFAMKNMKLTSRRSGTIEFAVGPEYYHKKERQPAPLSMLFMIEVTAQAVRNGVLTSFCNALKALLPSLPPKTRLGIATFGASPSALAVSLLISPSLNICIAVLLQHYSITATPPHLFFTTLFCFFTLVLSHSTQSSPIQLVLTFMGPRLLDCEIFLPN